jgi:hypothetical protein
MLEILYSSAFILIAILKIVAPFQLGNYLLEFGFSEVIAASINYSVASMELIVAILLHFARYKRFAILSSISIPAIGIIFDIVGEVLDIKRGCGCFANLIVIETFVQALAIKLFFILVGFWLFFRSQKATSA